MDKIEASACSYPLSYQYSKYLFYSSFLIGISSVVSLYYKDILSFIFLFMLFLSSINHWYKPHYGIGRNIDLILCKVIGLYFYGNTFVYYEEFYRECYMNGLYSIFFLFLMELLYYHFQNKKWIVFHMAIHLHLSFFVPFVLYML